MESQMQLVRELQIKERRKKFSGKLLADESLRELCSKRRAFNLGRDAFVDPKREIELLLPERKLVENISHQLALDAQFEKMHEVREEKRRGVKEFIYSIYEFLLSIFEKVKKKLKRRKRRLTKKGEEILEQLKYLAALCDVLDYRSPDEALIADSLFGEAYYEIMTLSSNLQKMRVEEEQHHIHIYSRNMAKILRVEEWAEKGAHHFPSGSSPF